MPLTFRERYCGHWNIPDEQFENHILDRVLYPPARWLRGLLKFLPGYFSPDREFIRSLGLIRSRRLFQAEAGEFHTDPANRLLMRRWLRLRVSAGRMRHAMDECWGDGSPCFEPVSADQSRR